MVPGTTFETISRHGLAHGQYPQAVGREEAWLAERLHAHHNPGGPLLQELPGNRWMRIDERRTRDGGIAGLRSEVTELVRREQELRRLNSRLDTLNGELAQLSDTDALTGLANRRHFDRCLAAEWVRAQRHQMPLALLLLDVDHFKRFNDRHGHPAGDSCLREVAKLLRSAARRPTDLVARIGGEEFAILLPHQDGDEAEVVALRCLAALARARIVHGDSPVAAHVTLSIGIAHVAHVNGSAGTMRDADVARLLDAADGALYGAKQQGRQRSVRAAAL
jgi:diguanylate cyclase (GGDEF)-like protein